MTNEEVIKVASQEWGQALHDLTGEQISSGLEYCRTNLEWPPSIAEFIKICKPNKSAGNTFWGAGHPSWDSIYGETKK